MDGTRLGRFTKKPSFCMKMGSVLTDCWIHLPIPFPYTQIPQSQEELGGSRAQC